MSELYNRDIQWFPGHMTKTLRSMERELPGVDAVIELLDARIPLSSSNPELERMAAEKPRLLLLNKADLADEAANRRWCDYFRRQGRGALAISSKHPATEKTVTAALRELLSQKMAARRERGMTGARIRAMVVGVPNVGKSTFINRLAGGAPAKTADRPGVTRGKQWITLAGFDLLDMPGVLWPKFSSRDTALRLAVTGAIRDEIMDSPELAAYLLSLFKDNRSGALSERYKLSDESLGLDLWGLLAAIARKRGMILPGNEPDLERASVMLLDEFRGGLLGRVTLEEPPK